MSVNPPATPAPATPTPVVAPAAAPVVPVTPAPSPVAPAATPAVIPVATPAVAPAAAPVPAPAPVAPVEPVFDLKLPADSLLDPAHVEKVTAFAKEQKLAPEVAQTLLQREHDAVTGYATAQKSLVETEKAGWMKTVEGDAELGGQYLARTVETTKRVVERYASDEFKKIMDNTGFGNHPEFVRFVARLGKAMTEDQLIIAPVTPAPVVKKDAASMLYDHPGSKK